MPAPMYRYPGSSPFTPEFKNLFFGRDQDLSDLYRQLAVHRLTVLYGKSGLGKSSLLNAGLIPMMERPDHQYVSVLVRFSAYQAGSTDTPESIFLKRIRQLSGTDAFLPVVEPAPDTLWQVFKQFEWKNRDKKGILLVLDQFEEIFTYPEGIDSFALRFSELLNNRMPDDFRQKLYNLIGEQPEMLRQYATEINFTEQSPNLKLLIGIRSDKLSLLDRLSSHVPNILRNCFELKPLDREQATQAIVLPAAEERHGPYYTHPFRYAPEAISKILDFLTHGGTRPVEPFLLQIICQHVEAMAPRVDAGAAPAFVVEPEPLGDLDSVTRLYYANVLRMNDEQGHPVFSAFERLNIRFLIERNLIETRSQVRVTLDKNLVEKKGISGDLIDKLVDSRLIRREPNAVSGLSYELSHDTLVDPILRASDLLGDLDEQTLDFYQKALFSAPEISPDALQQFIERELADREGQPRNLLYEHIAGSDRKAADALLRAGIARLEPMPEGHSELGLYHLFLRPALTLRAERAEKILLEKDMRIDLESEKRKRAVVFSVITSILSIVAIAATVFAYNSQKQAEKYAMEARNNEATAKKAQTRADSLAELAYGNATLARQKADDAIVAWARTERERKRAEASARALQVESNNLKTAQAELALALQEAQRQADTALVNFKLAQAREMEALRDRRLSDSLAAKLKTEGELLDMARSRAEQLSRLYESRARTAASYELTALAYRSIDSDPALALRLAEGALKKADHELARNAVLLSWYADQGRSLDSLPAQYRGQPLSPNGPYVIEVEGDGPVVLLNSKGEAIQRFVNTKDPKTKPQKTSFTLDGKLLVVEYANRTLYLPLDPDDILRRADAAGVRRLSQAECKLYNVDCQ